jgi:hypothetical protein
MGLAAQRLHLRSDAYKGSGVRCHAIDTDRRSYAASPRRFMEAARIPAESEKSEQAQEGDPCRIKIVDHGG